MVSAQSSNNPLFRLTKKVGSPRYMSPEVALGEYYNELTDVYALGLLSYEILSLKRPYHTNINNNNNNINGDIVVVHDTTIHPPPSVKKNKKTTTTTITNHNSDCSSRRRQQGSLSRRQPRRKSRGRGKESKDLQLRQKQDTNNNTTAATKKNLGLKYVNVRPFLPMATPREQQQLLSTATTTIPMMTVVIGKRKEIRIRTTILGRGIITTWMLTRHHCIGHVRYEQPLIPHGHVIFQRDPLLSNSKNRCNWNIIDFHSTPTDLNTLQLTML